MIWVIKGSEERIQDFNGMVSYITLWRQLPVLVSHIQLHIAQSISFRIIQMLGTFCIDSAAPLWLKKYKSIMLFAACMWIWEYYVLRGKICWKAIIIKYHRCSPRIVWLGRPNMIKMLIKKFRGKNRCLQGFSGLFPIEDLNLVIKKRLVFQRHKITFFSFP